MIFNQNSCTITDAMNFPQAAQWIGDRQRGITGEPPCSFLRYPFFLTAPVKRATFHYDLRRFFHKWLQDLRDGQNQEGAYHDTAPYPSKPPKQKEFWGLGRFGNAAWADAGIICPWKIYWHYGDKEILRENYEAMSHWLAYQQRTSKNLIRPRTAYGDWLAIDAVRPEHAPVPSDLIVTAYFARGASLMAKIAKVLGQGSDSRRFAELHQKIVAAFQNAYVTPSGRLVGHCQTAYLFALAFDLLPPALRPRALAHLVDLIEVRERHLTTGFVGTPLLLPVLSRFGRSDLAYEILLKEDYPSWLYTVQNGATTMWERWNSYTKEHGFGPVGMNSFNHYAYGAVGEWMYSTIGGISALSPGFKKMPLRTGTRWRIKICKNLAAHTSWSHIVSLANPRQKPPNRNHHSARCHRKTEIAQS